MMTPASFKSLLLAAACALAAHAAPLAQSGRRPPQLAPLPAPAPEPTPSTARAPIDTTNFEKVKLVVSRGVEDFVRDLNEQGRLGYRLEQSVSYGERYELRKYAAVLSLDPGHAYEYAYDRMPDSMLYGQPLDYYARRGYSLVESYAVAECPPVHYSPDSNDPSNPDNWPVMKMLSTVKTNAFLFMRRDGVAEQTREYRLYTGQVGWGENLRETIQAALDDAPPGSRPVRLLFTGPGLLSFGVSLVLERDLRETDPARVEYQVFKETRDMLKEINRRAAGGARYVAGGRINDFKVALLARGAPAASDYTLLDDHKTPKGFDKLVAAGYTYQGMMGGDLSCDSAELVSQKLVFAREAAGPARQYKILSLPEPKPGKPPAAAFSELQRLAGEGFRVRDLFYSYGLKVILEN